MKGIDKRQAPKEGDRALENESSEDEEEAEKVIEQVMDSLKLEDHALEDELSCDRKQDVVQEQEYPWCMICNEDATLRCQECDGEIFCIFCFKECHKDYDIRSHIGSPYKSK